MRAVAGFSFALQAGRRAAVRGFGERAALLRHELIEVAGPLPAGRARDCEAGADQLDHEWDGEAVNRGQQGYGAALRVGRGGGGRKIGNGRQAVCMIALR